MTTRVTKKNYLKNVVEQRPKGKDMYTLLTELIYSYIYIIFLLLFSCGPS